MTSSQRPEGQAGTLKAKCSKECSGQNNPTSSSVRTAVEEKAKMVNRIQIIEGHESQNKGLDLI